MGVQSLAREDLLEKEMATHSSILAWRIPWIEEPGGLQSDLTKHTHIYVSNSETIQTLKCNHFVWLMQIFIYKWNTFISYHDHY